MPEEAPLDHPLDQIVVVGGSLAGLRAVEELRHRGFDGRITVISDEAHMPYDRPPLSKQVLAGKWEPDAAMLQARNTKYAAGYDKALNGAKISA